MRIFILLLFFLCSSCNELSDFRLGVNKDKQHRIDKIDRLNQEKDFLLPSPKLAVAPHYPWDNLFIGKHPKIAIDFFRCHGSANNPIHTEEVSGSYPVVYKDCGGWEEHGLPLLEGKEFIYPILIELLNYLQARLGKKVVITCGHRCPAHNTYSDPSPYNRGSKHMIGAEVDFYVQGLENEAEVVIEALMEFYQQNPRYHDAPDYQKFVRYEKDSMNVLTEPWYNKEIFIKLYLEDEGRDWDNRHPFPYIGVQVRYDRDREHRVSYTWDQAHNYLKPSGSLN
ncbi:MAG: hypothetical protein CMO81_07740 [Waddliaceae bacterium]|nr:hypothetical protein [Waddliaceae bacterium]